VSVVVRNTNGGSTVREQSTFTAVTGRGPPPGLVGRPSVPTGPGGRAGTPSGRLRRAAVVGRGGRSCG
jgi:hypothetical protein